MVSLVASMVTAEPPASGAISVTWSTNCAQTLRCVRACGVGITCTRARPSGSSQSRETSGGIDVERHRLGAQHGAQPVELIRQEARQIAHWSP